MRYVPKHEVRDHWAAIRPGLEHALAKCGERSIPEDIYHELVSGLCSLWLLDEGFVVIATDDAGPRAMFVKALYAPGAGEREQEIWRGLEDMGRANGCKYLRWYSTRRAWRTRAAIVGYIFEREL